MTLEDAQNDVPLGELFEEAKGDRNHFRRLIDVPKEIKMNQSIRGMKIDAGDRLPDIRRPKEAGKIA